MKKGRGKGKGSKGPRRPPSDVKRAHRDFQLSPRPDPNDDHTHVVLTVWSAAWAARALHHISATASIAGVYVALDASCAAWLQETYGSSSMDGRRRPEQFQGDIRSVDSLKSFTDTDRGRSLAQGPSYHEIEDQQVEALQLMRRGCPQVLLELSLQVKSAVAELQIIEREMSQCL